MTRQSNSTGQQSLLSRWQMRAHHLRSQVLCRLLCACRAWRQCARTAHHDQISQGVTVQWRSPLIPYPRAGVRANKERPRWPGMAITGAAVSGKGYAVQKCAEFLPRPGSEARCKKRRKRERVGCRRGHSTANSHGTRRGARVSITCARRSPAEGISAVGLKPIACPHGARKGLD